MPWVLCWQKAGGAVVLLLREITGTSSVTASLYWQKLVITYADGRTNVVVTDPLSWQYFGKGPVAYGSFFQGEVYDALREPVVEGWSTASYDASAWKPAHEVALEGHISKGETRICRG